VVDVEDQGTMERVGAGGQGFLQDAVTATMRPKLTALGTVANVHWSTKGSRIVCITSSGPAPSSLALSSIAWLTDRPPSSALKNARKNTTSRRASHPWLA
jgi:hypothetical protein